LRAHWVIKKRVKKIIVASTNPVKIEATLEGFRRMFGDELFEAVGVVVESGVSNQPMSEEETLEGAINRVGNAMQVKEDGDYWIGIEGGLEEIDGGMEAFAWVVVKSKNGKVGRGRTGSFFLPDQVVQLIKEGKELGEADDIVFGMTNSKQANGAVGILSGDVITRKSFYEEAVILALIPFRNQTLY